MQASAKSDVAAIALRIYLVHSLHQTEDLLRDATFRAEVVSGALCLSSNAPWVEVVSACRRVIKYITNCQYDDGKLGGFVRGFHGLCAIEAAQDALYRSIVYARANERRRYQSGPNLSSYNQSGYTMRAKFINNGIVAMNSNDQELYHVWMHSAKFAIHAEEDSKDLTSSEYSVMLNMERAWAVESGAKLSDDAKIVQMRRQAATFYRRAAAHSYGSTYNAQLHASKAASTFKDAIQLYVKSLEDTENCPESAPLWQSAVATMCLAGEMYAAQEQSISSIEDVVRQADNLASHARIVPEIVADVDKLQTLLDTMSTFVLQYNMAHNPSTRDVWQALTALTRKKLLFLKQLLRGAVEGQATSRDRNFTSIIKRIEEVVKKLRGWQESSQYFKKMAKQPNPVPHSHLWNLSQRCWLAAGAHMDKAVESCAKFLVFVDGEVRELSSEAQSRLKLHSDAATTAACIAECIVPRAAGHLDAARGAERREGSDPREAQYYRGAADCLTQAAEQMYATVHPDVELVSGGISTDSRVSLVALRREGAYCRAADHLRNGPQDQEHKERLSELYELFLSVLCDDRDDADSQDVASSAEYFIEQYEMSLSEGNISAKSASVFVFGTSIVLGACRSALDFESSAATEILRSAIDAIREALDEPGDEAFALSDLICARAALLQLAAASAKMVERDTYMQAAKILSRTVYYANNFPLIAYNISLALRLLTQLTIPPLLLQLQTKYPTTDSAVLNMISGHAAAYKLNSKCRRRAESRHTPAGVARLAWEQATVKTRELIRLREHQVKSLSQMVPVPHILTTITLQEMVVRCFIGAAVSVHSPPVLALWERATAQCREIAALPRRFTGKIMKAVAAVELLAQAAEAKQAEMGGLDVAQST